MRSYMLLPLCIVLFASAQAAQSLCQATRIQHLIQHSHFNKLKVCLLHEMLDAIDRSSKQKDGRGFSVHDSSCLCA